MSKAMYALGRLKVGAMSKAEAAGERLDSESGLEHAAHAAWCALARLDLMLRQGEAG